MNLETRLKGFPVFFTRDDEGQSGESPPPPPDWLAGAPPSSSEEEDDFDDPYADPHGGYENPSAFEDSKRDAYEPPQVPQPGSPQGPPQQEDEYYAAPDRPSYSSVPPPPQQQPQGFGEPPASKHEAPSDPYAPPQQEQELPSQPAGDPYELPPENDPYASTGNDQWGGEQPTASMPPPPPPSGADPRDYRVSQDEIQPGSAPDYQQPTIRDLREFHSQEEQRQETPYHEEPPQEVSADPPSGVDALRHAAAPPGGPPNLELEQQAQGDRPAYSEQQFGDQIGSGLDASGFPKYDPLLPEEQQEDVALSRRVAGMVWLFFAALMTFGAFLIAEERGAGATLAVMAPMMAIGLILLTGTRFSGILGMAAGVVYGLIFIFLALLVLANDAALERAVSVDAIPPIMSVLLGALGVAFIISTLLMLAGNPGNTRVTFGAVILVLAQAGAMLYGSSAEMNFRQRLTDPSTTLAAKEFGSPAEGLLFTKPEGWAGYPWPMIQASSVLAHALETEPNYVFLNNNQDMMLAVYLTDIPPVSISALFEGDSLSPLEQEILRGLPPEGDAADQFNFQGLDFSERTYSGVIGNGRRLATTIDKARYDGQLLVIALTRDLESNDSTRDGAEEALNRFFQSLRLVEPAES